MTDHHNKQEKEKENENQKENEWPDLTGAPLEEHPIPDEKERMEIARAELLDFDEMKKYVFSDSAYIGERLEDVNWTMQEMLDWNEELAKRGWGRNTLKSSELELAIDYVPPQPFPPLSSSKYPYQFNVLIIGPCCSGKTTVLNQIIKDSKNVVHVKEMTDLKQNQKEMTTIVFDDFLTVHHNSIFLKSFLANPNHPKRCFIVVQYFRVFPKACSDFIHSLILLKPDKTDLKEIYARFSNLIKKKFVGLDQFRKSVLDFNPQKEKDWISSTSVILNQIHILLPPLIDITMTYFADFWFI